MVAEATTIGLIVSTSSEHTAPLEEVIACCGWPVLIEATPLRLRRELAVRIPRLSLFWLDDAEQITATAQLVAWLSAFQPGVRRIAMGYQLAAEAESWLRTAGAHAYLPVSQDVGAAIESSLSPLLDGLLAPADRPAAAPLLRLGDHSRASPTASHVHRSWSP